MEYGGHRIESFEVYGPVSGSEPAVLIEIPTLKPPDVCVSRPQVVEVWEVVKSYMKDNILANDPS